MATAAPLFDATQLLTISVKQDWIWPLQDEYQNNFELANRIQNSREFYDLQMAVMNWFQSETTQELIMELQMNSDVFEDLADELDDIPSTMAEVPVNVTYIANGPGAGDFKITLDTKAVEQVAEELADAIEELKDILDDEDNQAWVEDAAMKLLEEETLVQNIEVAA
jgi:hypothetical protein